MIKPTRRLVKVWQLGRISYAQALKLQKHLADLHESGDKTRNTLLCLEHPPVYTVGIRGNIYSAQEEESLISKGAEFCRTNRGGLITFHGPGQLVVYPILNLKHFNPSMRWYVCNIEKTVINLCKKYDLKAVTSPDTGVWINDNKLCAVGIHGSRFITTHGLALNCDTDLTWFNHIVPCGIKDKGVTSMSKELNRSVSIDDVLPKFLDSFSQVFDCDYCAFPSEDAKQIIDSLHFNN